ncbi:class I SAM-dependent methyltransferase [Arsenicicoccus dermatophilus]|uniref:class I SAM-dependent methyltransferase n=1 Tax=Arsenicicoccus dermatophilus TaxID=1076331 RepID=UPI003916E032
MSDDSTTARTRWAELVGDDGGADYERRIRESLGQMADRGENPHGEADLVLSLLPEGGRVLDAGCGTGRVALRLAALGVPVVGVDADLSMLRVAAEQDPRIPFWLSDLADLDLPQGIVGAGFDMVLMAGNVVPLLAPGTLEQVMHHLAGVLRPGGVLVAGFGLDRDHLPGAFEPTSLADYDRACAAAGLTPSERYATWQRDTFTGEGYAVSVHRHAPAPAPSVTSRLRGLLRR